MALKALLTEEEYAALEEGPVKAEYDEVEAGGKKSYVLQIEGVAAHPQVTALKNTVDHVKRERKGLQDKLTAAEARLAALPDDFDPEEFARLREEEAERLKNPDARPDAAALQSQKTMFEQRLSSAERKRAEDLAAKDAEIAKRDAIIERREVGDRLTTEVRRVGVPPHFEEAVVSLLRGKVKTRRNDETAEVEAFFDTDLGDATVPEFLDNWAKSDSGKAFIPKPTGGGAQGSGGGGSKAEKNPWSSKDFNLTEQGRITRDDPAKAARLKAAAGNNRAAA